MLVTTMLSNLPKTIFSTNFIVSSANAFNLDRGFYIPRIFLEQKLMYHGYV